MSFLILQDLRLMQEVQIWQTLKLLMETFDRATLEPEEQLRAEMAQVWGMPVRYMVAEDAGEVVGVVRWLWLPKSQAQFIIHLVTARERRGEGIGSRLLEAVRADALQARVVLETEPDDESARWWRSRGAWTVSSTYRQPPLHADTGPMPFDLMVIGDVEDPEQFVRSFYGEAWERGEEDEYVQEALRGVSARKEAHDQGG